MEILAVIVVIALLAAVAFTVVQRRPAGGLRRPRRAPLGRGVRSDHPMTEVVVDHANATGDQEVIAAEQRMKAQARRVAASMQGEAMRTEHQRAAEQMADGDPYAADPRIDGYVDPATDPRDDERVDRRRDDRTL